jgi:hypothetical protein
VEHRFERSEANCSEDDGEREAKAGVGEVLVRFLARTRCEEPDLEQQGTGDAELDSCRR